MGRSRTKAHAAQARPQPTLSAPLRGVRWRAAILVIAAALAYANSLSKPFIFDDDASIVENTTIRDLRPSSSLFPNRESPTAGRPVVNFSFALNYAIGGLNVTGYHVANIAIHALCGLVLFGIVRRTLELPGTPSAWHEQSMDLAFATALLWVVHPLNSEAVDYLTERTESLMALFYLLTSYCAIRAAGPVEAVDDLSARSRGWTVISILCCALGMACKESMATAPLMIALYDRVFLFDSIKRAWRARWTLYAGLAATWIVLVVLLQSGPRVHSAGFRAGVDVSTYVVNQFVMIVRYLRLAIWPRSLVLAYGVPLQLSLADVWPQLLIVVSLIVLTAVILALRPRLGFLLASVFITLAPTSTIVPIATEVGAERRMYLPLAALIALGVVAIGTRIRKSVAAGILVTLATALAAQTALRNREYESSFIMAQTVLDRWSTDFAHALVGVELAVAGRHDEALMHLRQAARTYSRARFHLGGELFNAGETDEALVHLQQFVQEQPQILEAVRARTMIGRALYRRHEYAAAVEQFRLVTSMTPSGSDAHVTAIGYLADALFGQEKFDEAARAYRAYLARRPNDGGGWTNFGIALANTGKLDEATDAFRRAVTVNATDVTARRNLASALFNQGRMEDAASEARQLLRLNQNDVIAHDLLGRVLGSAGKFAEARAEFERALQIDPNDQQTQQDLALLKKTMGIRD
jgi:tetratricopeptide (TPR) repeat protein